MPRFSSYGALDNPLVDEGDTGFLRMNARLRPDQLKEGELALSVNGRMDINGSWQLRRGVDSFGGGLVTGDTPLILPFYLGFAIATASRTTNVVTVVTSTPHGFTSGEMVAITGLTVFTDDPNGTFTITVTNTTTFTYADTGTDESFTVTGAYASNAILTDSAVNAVYGSCLFSDPSSDNQEHIIIATNSKAIAINLSDGTSQDLDYPMGETISAPVNMIQAFNYVFIFRDGITAMQWDGNFSSDFTLVANGTYAANVYLNASNNTTIADGLVTVSESAHGLAVGDQIFVVDNGSTLLTENGDGYTVASVPTSGSFTFPAQVADSTATTVVYTRKVSEGLGFTHMPAPPWAIYHQRRLWMPFLYTTTGSSGSPSITSRDIRDEIIASDILDQDTYDQIENQYRIASGGADYVVAIQPFAEDNLVVFNRNTIHLVTGVGGDLAQSSVREITREVGCLARKTVVQVGNQILFLSDNGVYSVDFGDLYNLRGAALPLSEPIQPIIKRINNTYADKCVAVYHDNRYYIAVPLDDSTENNAILIYNFLNAGWESVDQINQNGWNIANIIRAGASGVNKLYAINSEGGIHILDEREDDVDVVNLQIGGSDESFYIEGYMTTRQYTQGIMDRKRFNSFEIQVESSDTNTSDATISFEAENPDSVTALNTFSDLLGDVIPVSEDASMRGRIGNIRGYGGQFTITPTQGRPKVRSLKVVSQLTDLGISSKE